MGHGQTQANTDKIKLPFKSMFFRVGPCPRRICQSISTHYSICFSTLLLPR
jgi:hypothetical protein